MVPAIRRRQYKRQPLECHIIRSSSYSSQFIAKFMSVPLT